MINRKILIMIYISLVIFITIMFIILSILGSKSRYGYFGNFVMNEGNIDETLRMNEMYDIKTNFQKTLTNDKGEIKIITDNKSIIKFILLWY